MTTKTPLRRLLVLTVALLGITLLGSAKARVAAMASAWCERLDKLCETLLFF